MNIWPTLWGAFILGAVIGFIFLFLGKDLTHRNSISFVFSIVVGMFFGFFTLTKPTIESALTLFAVGGFGAAIGWFLTQFLACLVLLIIVMGFSKFGQGD